MHVIRFQVPLLLILAVVGCQSYQAKPLIPAEVLEEVEASRNLLASTQEISSAEGDRAAGTGFIKAARLMERLSPRLKRARAAYDQAGSLAEIDTPFPNPEFSAGANIGTDLESDSSDDVEPMVELGFTIPLNGRLSLQDDVNDALADEAFVQLVVVHRAAYLDLRKLYTDWFLAGRHLSIQENICESARKSLDLTERLVKAGAASALDLGLMGLEAAQQEAELVKARTELLEVEEALSRLIGISIPALRSTLAPELPPMEHAVPLLDEAKTFMVANNPALAGLRARYEVAERELRLEIRKQYPDLSIGASFEGEPGESKEVWGLSLGIALPIFDRNQQGIKVAEMEREKARSEYEAALSEALAALEGLHERHALALEAQRLIRDTVLPKSQANVDVALRSIQAGAIDSLKYLEVERTMRSLLIEAIHADQEIWTVVIDLERAMGVPLVKFPAEEAEDYPRVPEPGSHNNDMETQE